MRMLRVLAVVLMMAAAGLLTGGPAHAAPSPVAAGLTLAPAAPGRAPGTPCRATARACVDLSANRAWLIKNGVVVYGPVRIAHGKAGHRTPTGTFRVSFKSRNHVSSIYGSPMPNSVFFNGGIAFHQGDLGSRSHGCVRLSGAASRTFFSFLRPGQVVQVVR